MQEHFENHSHYSISTMISFLRRNGKLIGGLYWADIISHFMIYPSRERRSFKYFFFASTLPSVAYQVYLSTAFLDLSTFLKRMFALFGFGRVSREYLLGMVKAMVCFSLPEVLSITGTVIAIFSGARIVWRVALTPIDVFETFPPKIYPASCRNHA